MQTKRTLMTESFTISYENVQSGWNMPFIHHHNSYEIYILESGNRTVTIDECEYTVGAYDVTLFNRNVPHTSRGNTPFSGICIHIMDSFIDHYFTSDAKHQLFACFNNPVVHLCKEEFFKIKEFSDNFISNSPDNLFVFISIMEILKNACMRNEKYEVLIKKNPNTKAEAIIEYVNENYISINRIDDILEKFNVSESYIFKIFKQTYNTTPKKYLHTLKLNNVCMWLENRHGSIRSIAEKSGFESYEYFIRLFKKELGCTPTEYRKRYIIAKDKN